MEEQEEPKYGITSGYKRSNAYNAIFSYWGELFSLARKTKTLRNKINVFVKGPAYMPSDVTPVTTENSTTKVPYKVMIGNEKKAYLLLNVSITACCFIGLLYIRSAIGAQTSLEELINNKGFASLIGIVLISLFTHARLIENKKFAFLTDGIRLVAVVFLVSYGFENTLISSWLIPVVISYCFLMLLWLVKLKFNSNQSVLKT
jgi:hypothetical protein